ncbi:MAG: hypothetical protein COB51_14270 [Moraxellaceae bacterium]|nr:MAG: hypothetical protein COB51_14270 [Moraxellaceae bacterium]
MNCTPSKQSIQAIIQACLFVITLAGLTACGGNSADSDELIQSVILAEATDNGTTVESLNLFLQNGNDRIINENETAKLGATAILTNGSSSDATEAMSWSSSDPSILMESNGVLTGITKGTATLTGTIFTPNQITTELLINVSDAEIVPSSLEVLWPNPAPPCTTLSTQIRPVEFTDGTVRNVTEWATWSTSNATQAEIIALLPKEVDFVLYTDQEVAFNINVDDVDYPQFLTATEAPQVSVVLQDGGTLLASGETRSLQAISVYPANGAVTESIEQYLDWSSDFPSIASVENTNVTGVGSGETVIRGRCGDIEEEFATLSLDVISIDFEGIVFFIDDEEIGSGEISQYQIINIGDEETKIRAFADLGQFEVQLEDTEDWEVTSVDSSGSVSDIASIRYEEDHLLLTPLSAGKLEIKAFFDEDESDDDNALKEAVLKLEIK